MPTTVDCPTCSRKLRIPDELLGKKVKCPQCGNAFVASASAPAPEEIGEEETPAPPPRRRRKSLKIVPRGGVGATATSSRTAAR
jgi:predicted Zn finger-like uncharacterized protein